MTGKPIRRTKSPKKVLSKQWTDATVESLQAFCTKPSYANMARALLSFECTGECEECLLLSSGSCPFLKLYDPENSQGDFHPANDWRVNMKSLEGERHVHLRIYSFPKDFVGFCRRHIKSTLAELILGGTQLLAWIEALGESNA